MTVTPAACTPCPEGRGISPASSRGLSWHGLADLPGLQATASEEHRGVKRRGEDRRGEEQRVAERSTVLFGSFQAKTFLHLLDGKQRCSFFLVLGDASLSLHLPVCLDNAVMCFCCDI